MLAQGCGKIINTASMASLLVPHPQKQAAYNASKAAGLHCFYFTSLH
jgi:NAD(P)-dependent dehydrogenase (short-subunit alcohol dehydrogenase family)